MKSVLVIDDDKYVLRAMSRMLGQRFAVTPVATVEDAVRLIEAGERFDAIVCDMCVGASSGREFLERLLARSSAQAERVLFVTGSEGDDDAFARETAHRRLVKPVPVDVLLARVEQIASTERVAA